MEKILILEILSWIFRTFGESARGDTLEITHLNSIPGEKVQNMFITEMRISLHKHSYDPEILNKKAELRNELDAITDFSIRKLQFIESSVSKFASEDEIKKHKVSREATFGGKALMMKLEIFHVRRISNDES